MAWNIATRSREPSTGSLKFGGLSAPVCEAYRLGSSRPGQRRKSFWTTSVRLLPGSSAAAKKGTSYRKLSLRHPQGEHRPILNVGDFFEAIAKQSKPTNLSFALMTNPLNVFDFWLEGKSPKSQAFGDYGSFGDQFSHSLRCCTLKPEVKTLATAGLFTTEIMDGRTFS